MKDITALLNCHREAVRGVWNNYLRTSADFDSVDALAEVSSVLFREIVLRQLGRRDFTRASRTDTYTFIHVVPEPDGVPIMINRPSTDGNMYWDDPVNHVNKSKCDLLFIDYFDWDQIDYIDCRYYRVRI